MKITSGYRSLSTWLFDYPEKLDINIHDSLTSRPVLIIGRFIALLILSYRYILSIVVYDSSFIMIQYLTQLGYIFTWIYFALVNEDYLLNERRGDKKAKALREWVNLIFECALCMETVVTILFWSVLYDYSREFEVVSFLKELGVHGFPFVCLVFDWMLNVYQFPKRHLLVVILLGNCYLAVNVGYSLAIAPVYRPLDWVSVMCYVYVVACEILVFAVHTLLRKHWQKYCRPQLELSRPYNESILSSDSASNSK